MVADQVKKRPKALQKCARDFADGLLEYICSENENYKYVLIATKENANMLMKEVLSLSLSLISYTGIIRNGKGPHSHAGIIRNAKGLHFVLSDNTYSFVLPY